MTPKGGDEERQVVSERNSNLAPLYHIQLSERVGDFFFFFLPEDGGGQVGPLIRKCRPTFCTRLQSNNQKDFDLEWVVTVKSNLQEN